MRLTLISIVGLFGPIFGLLSCRSAAPAREDLADAAVAHARESGGLVKVPAANVRGPVRGQWDFTLGGVGGNDEDFDAGGGQLTAGLGYFVTDFLEFAVRQNVSFSDAGPGSPDLWNAATRIALDVHFIPKAVSPFVGVNFGYVYGDSVEETLAAGPEAGLKVYVSDSAFLQALAEYEFFFDDDDRISSAFETGQFIYGLSIGLRF